MKQHKIKLATALMLAFLAVVTTFNITFFAATEYYNGQLDDLEKLESRYSKLKSVADIVDKYYIADYQESSAVEGALAGYIDGLGDKWSAYYTTEETAANEEDESNTYVGIGVTYSTDATSLYAILTVVKDGPADKAGMKVGDIITAVDGTAVSTLQKSSELTALVKGVENTTVKITVKRGTEEKTFDVTRASIYQEGVTTKMLSGDIGYVAIANFDSGVDEEFTAKLNSLVNKGAKALIFDVRNNPGGYLTVMRDILDQLLPEGVVITTVDKQGNETQYDSDASCITLPMAVITNQYSISAAEFFAAALQEYSVATVVGEPTSGKGYSQQTFKLQDGSSVHISTTRYYTPKGNSLADVGITPDVLSKMSAEDFTKFCNANLADSADVQLQDAIKSVNAQLANP